MQFSALEARCSVSSPLPGTHYWTSIYEHSRSLAAEVTTTGQCGHSGVYFCPWIVTGRPNKLLPVCDTAVACHEIASANVCCCMQDFKMASSRIGYEGGASLASALTQGTCLRTLDLHDNPMTFRIGSSLSMLLPSHPNLTTLVLSDVCLQDEGAKALAIALAAPDACPMLEVLELALNEITRESTPSLAKALAAHASTLKRLVLADNELECAGAIHIAVGLKDASHLKKIDLKTNQIGRVGAMEVARCCCHAKPELELVEMDDNLISAEGIDEVWLGAEAQFGLLTKQSGPHLHLKHVLFSNNIAYCGLVRDFASNNVDSVTLSPIVLVCAQSTKLTLT
jgi:Ran GTPase-activating protein (RanGAP) involved in mRNA processing and transport